MKIGPASMMIVLAGIGIFLAKEAATSLKKEMIKKIKKKLESKNNFKTIDF